MITRRHFNGGAAALGATALAGCAPLPPGLPGPAPDPSAAPFDLGDLEHRTFTGYGTPTIRERVVPDRWQTKSFSSIAAVGFGLTAYPVGVERGGSPAPRRAPGPGHAALFANAPMGPEAAGRTGHRGFFYHFIDMNKRPPL